MRETRARSERLIEANGATKVVIVLCDCWYPASFDQELREELRAFDKSGIRFIFWLVGVPDMNLNPVPVEFGRVGQ